MGFFSRMLNPINPLKGAVDIAKGTVKGTIGGITDAVNEGAPASGGGTASNALAMALQSLLAQQQAAKQMQSTAFQRAATNIQPSFFQNPQALAALRAILSGGMQASQAPAPKVDEIPARWDGGLPYNQPALQPGPAPSGAVMMGKVGGFGNGGGKMGMQPGRWIRAY